MENTLKMIMKKQNQTALKEKIVVGGVVVIAICMVLILLLLFLDHSNKAIDNQALNDAINGEYAADEHVPEELESEEVQATENPYYQNEEVSATESPYYKYDGELSDTPIMPTEIENEDILDYFGDDALKAKFKKEIMDYVVDYAKKSPVYGNPTIIPGCEPVWFTDRIFVDIHATDNRIVSFAVSEDDKNKMLIQVSYMDDEHWPVVYEGLYILNSSDLYYYLTNYVGVSSEDANKQELEILKLIKKGLDDRGYTKEMYEKTPYIYLNNGESVVDENGEIIGSNLIFFASAETCHPYIRVFNDIDMNDGAFSLSSHYILKLSKEKRN
ncbi:MAG: hypothetical protein II992_10305 [Lachnospiraceae bacterium]|nr:hypothetical protein [Lachnospiraceae bacterium]